MKLTDTKGLIELLAAPWAIAPNVLRQIERTAEIYMRDAKAESLRRISRTDRASFDVRDGVAVLPAHGIIVKHPTILGLFFQETSTEEFASDFQAALQSPNVHSLVLHVDSPGGVVDGTEALASLIYGARGSKPIVAVIDGIGASAAYWVAAAAERVYITGEATQVGSIGVIATHTDVSKAEEARGVRVSEIVSGKFKNIVSPHAPLSADGRAALQETVDYLCGLFCGAVAQFRGVPPSQVAATEARLFFGQQAVKAGLVDGVRSFQTITDGLRSANGSSKKTAPSVAKAAAPKTIMDRIFDAGLSTDKALERLAAEVPPKAVQTVAPQQVSKLPDAEPAPHELARKAEQYRQRRLAAGIPCTTQQAVSHVSKRDADSSVEENALRIAEFVAEERRRGNSCTPSQAAARLGISS